MSEINQLRFGALAFRVAGTYFDNFYGDSYNDNDNNNNNNNNNARWFYDDDFCIITIAQSREH